MLCSEVVFHVSSYNLVLKHLKSQAHKTVFNHHQSTKELSLTIGPRSQHMAVRAKFWPLDSQFNGKFGFRLCSVGPGRSLELADRTGLTKMTV